MKTKLLLTLVSVVFYCSIMAQVVPGNALSFNGNTYAVCGQINTTAFSVDVWVKPMLLNSNQAIVSTLNELTLTGFELYLGADNRFGLIIRNGTEWLHVVSYDPVEANKWVHLVATFNGFNADFYVNGDWEAGKNANLYLAGSSYLHLGVRSSGAYLFNGVIDECRIWDKALTQEEIIRQSNYFLNGYEPGLKAYYQFDEESGTSLIDKTGTYNATLLGIPAWVESYAMVVPYAFSAENVLKTKFTAIWLAPDIGQVEKYYLDVSSDSDFSTFHPGYQNLDCGTSLSKEVIGLNANTRYYYRVRAEKASVSGQGTYSNIAAKNTLSASIDPVITWANPADIPYGTPLSATQLNAIASYNGQAVNGTYTYTPDFNSILNSGNNQELQLLFTPTDNVNFNTVQVTVKINVLKLSPAIAWADPSYINYSVQLSAMQLNATASHNSTTVDGVFTYSPAVGSILNSGFNQKLKTEFVPTDTDKFKIVKDSVYIDVYKAMPYIIWANPNDITYGTALSTTQLNAAASYNGQPVDGTFDYLPAIDSIMNAGSNQNLSLVFTPNDLVNYYLVKDTVQINVLKVSPEITWANPADIVYGTALSATQLNATASYNGQPVDGTFDYSPAIDSIMNVGSSQNLSLVFTPDDLVNYYLVKDTVQINALKARPEITWENPADIVYGTLLDDTQLNASANMPGTFNYYPDFGTELNPGTEQSLNVTFTPDDTIIYNTITQENKITVLSNPLLPTYCDASVFTGILEYISNVALGAINYNSGSNNYENNTSQITDLEINTIDTIKVSVGRVSPTDIVLVWIDWNRDFDFDDENEQINTSIGDTSNCFTAALWVPENAMPGRTRMRIKLVNANVYNSQEPCGSNFSGEIEDYSVNIIAPTSPMTYLLSESISDSVTYKGMKDQPVMRIDVQMNASVNPLDITSFRFNTNSKLSPESISNAKLYYTGGNDEFSDTLQYGITYNAPMGEFEINGSQSLTSHNNYFWLCYDIAGDVPLNDVIFVQASEITIDGTKQVLLGSSDTIIIREFSFEITQNIDPVFAGNQKQDIIRLSLNNKSKFSRKLNSIAFNIDGTTDISEVSNFNVFSTGLQNHYALQTQFGETQGEALNSVAFFGSQWIYSGDNYLWFTTDISETATNNNAVDAGLISITINDLTLVPSQSSPDSARIISNFNGNTYTNFMPASMVIGQPDFYTQDLTIDQDGGFNAYGVAISSKGMLAMTSQKENIFTVTYGRVLLWNSIPEADGTPADIVIGQPDFTSSVSNSCSAYEIKGSISATFSPDGEQLLVTDPQNNRVLIFHAPFTNGMAASVVIGQTYFDSNSAGCSDSKLNYPHSVYVHSDGRLFIVERGNNRVLIYNKIPTVNGASADLVIGQPDFVSSAFGCSPTNLSFPNAVTVSANGKLIVSDGINNRVLVYNSIPLNNGASADVVIGQLDLTRSIWGTTDWNLRSPFGVSISHDGKLAIGDFNNSRVLIYNAIPTENGARADIVLGQPVFNSGIPFNGGISDRSMSQPNIIAYDLNGRLFVAGRDMHRIMVYGEAPAAEADLDINLSIDDASFDTDSTITYVLKLKNNGPNSASNLEVNFQLPYQFIFLSAQGSGVYTNNKWSISSIGSNVEREIMVIAKLKSNNVGETIRATAKILYSDKKDPNLENNSSYSDFVRNIVWTGTVSSNWNDSLNWNIEKVPAMDQSAIIPATPVGTYFPEVFNKENYINNISIENGAYIHLPDTSDLFVFGNFKNLGDSATGNGNVGFAGNIPQTLEGKVSSIVITNGRDVSLSGNTFVRDAAFLLNGKLKLGNYDLQMGDTAKFSSKFGGKREAAKGEFVKVPIFFRSYIVTDGMGKLIQKVDTVAKEFPVGTETDYYGAAITNKGVADNYSIRVFPDVLEHGTSGNQVSDIDHFIKASWNIEEELAGGSELNLELNWQIPHNFDRMKIKMFAASSGIGMNSGSEWDKPILGSAELTKMGFTNVRDSITTMGTFAIGNSCSRLALQTSPVLIADNTGNNPLNAITLTFAENQVWADSIQSITIDDGIDIKANITILNDSIIISVGNFPEGNKDYFIEIISNGFTSTSLVQHICKVDQEIPFDPITGLVVNEPFVLVAQATSGLDINYVCTNLNIATINGNIANPLTTGNAIIIASQKGNEVYNAATSVQHAFTSYALGQAITFDPIAAKTYGDASFNVSATGGATANPIVFTSSDNVVATCSGTNGETITVVGAGSCKIYANQAGDATYAPALQQEQELIVNKATPVLTWSNPADITYGTLLSETQQNAIANIDGEIVYTPASGTKLNAGNNQELKVDFTPKDAVNYNTANKTVSINVEKVTPVLTWSNPADITYGTLLSETQLNATADIDGIFTYNPVLGTKLEVGNAQELKLDFAPNDAVNYNNAFKTVFINILQSTGIDDISKFELSVFPNPAANLIYINGMDEVKSSANIKIEIVDVSGKTHLIKEVNKGDLNPINIQSLPGGLYLMRIKTDKQAGSIKFIKE